MVHHRGQPAGPGGDSPRSAPHTSPAFVLPSPFLSPLPPVLISFLTCAVSFLDSLALAKLRTTDFPLTLGGEWGGYEQARPGLEFCSVPMEGRDTWGK